MSHDELLTLSEVALRLRVPLVTCPGGRPDGRSVRGEPVIEVGVERLPGRLPAAGVDAAQSLELDACLGLASCPGLLDDALGTSVQDLKKWPGVREWIEKRRTGRMSLWDTESGAGR